MQNFNYVPTIFILFVILFSTNTLFAQVTIGSNTPPIQGSLLQLKNIDGITDGSANATKGLGLPRVELKHIDELNPITMASGETNDSYIGLLVFNINNDICQFAPKRGLHVWNGKQWILLGKTDKTLVDQTKFVDNSDNTGILTDFEGNDYSARFYDESGWWMTQNLRSIQGKHGYYVDSISGLRQNMAYVAGGTTVGTNLLEIYCRENMVGDAIYSINGVQQTESSEALATKYGLLYNFKQSKKACPKGWLLPNYSEWISLLRSIDNTFNSVTSNTTGKEMKNDNANYTSADNSTYTWGGNNSSMFSALPAGKINSSGIPLGSVDFAKSIDFWANTTVAGSDDVFTWLLTYNSDAIVQKTDEIQTNYLSIRCMQELPVCDGSIGAGTVDQTSYDETNGILIDYEGNQYFTREFGEAGVWMTQNLRTKSFFDKFQCSQTDVLPKPDNIALNATLDAELKHYSYPKNAGDATSFGTQPTTWKEEFGLLYSYSATVRDFHKTTNTGDGGGKQDDIQVRGICPYGWHVPTDWEWSMLEQELATHPTEYSTYSTPTTWDDAYYTNPPTHYRPSNTTEGLTSIYDNNSYYNGVGHSRIMTATDSAHPQYVRDLFSKYILPGFSEIPGVSKPFNATDPKDRGFAALILGYTPGVRTASHGGNRVGELVYLIVLAIKVKHTHGIDV